MSVTGDEITYAPLAHLPRSISRQRWLQNGNSGSLACTDFLHVGHRNWEARFRGMCSDNPGYEVVVVALGDLAAIEFSRFGFAAFGKIIHKDLAINFWSMHGRAALEKKLAFF